MHLIQILLPLYDNEGRQLARTLFDQVRQELVQQFGGLTSYARAPVSGLWKEDEQAPPMRDDLVIYEVMADTLDADWWRQYRMKMEAQFRQKEIMIRAHQVQTL